MPLSSGNTQLR